MFGPRFGILFHVEPCFQSGVCMSETKIPRRNTVIALAVICVFLAGCLAGVVAFYTFTISDQNNTISSLKSQINELDSSLTTLQNQVTSENTIINTLISEVKDLEENGTAALWNIITDYPSFWLNRTVQVEGNISLFLPAGFEWPPWNYELNSSGTIVGVSWQGQDYSGQNVMVSGLVTEGHWNEAFANGTAVEYGSMVYFIQAEAINPL